MNQEANPYLTALNELLKQHSHSLQQPLKELSDRIQILEVDAGKEGVQENQPLFVQTSAGEKLWINYDQIVTVAVLPSKLPADSIFQGLPIQQAERTVVIYLSQPWNGAILLSLHRKIKHQKDKDVSAYKKSAANEGVKSANEEAIKIADRIAQLLHQCKVEKLTLNLPPKEPASALLEIKIKAVMGS